MYTADNNNNNNNNLNDLDLELNKKKRDTKLITRRFEDIIK